MKKIVRGAAVVGAGIALLAGGALLPGISAEKARGTAPAALRLQELQSSNTVSADLDGTIEALQRKIASDHVERADDHAALAFGYLQKARSEAFPRYYSRAERALDTSFAIQPKRNLEASLARAILAGARHDFHGQVAWGRRAIRISPFNSQAHGLVGDALLELGETDEALAEYQKSIDLRPDLAAFGRVSYAASVRGDFDGAVGALKRALGFAASKEDAAWARWQLGELHIGNDELSEAERHLAAALELVPGFTPALESTAHVAAARGDTQRAVEVLEMLVQDVPSPSYFNFLGELQLMQGHRESAEAAFEKADAKLRAYASYGVRSDVDFITFWADRGIHLQRALVDARRLYSERSTGAVSDALAWALMANAQPERALKYAREALRRSPGDAGFSYHAGRILLRLGKRAEGVQMLRQALEADPSWSILEAHRARAILRKV